MNRRFITAILWFIVAALFIAAIVLAACLQRSLSVDVIALDIVVFVACTWMADSELPRDIKASEIGEEK